MFYPSLPAHRPMFLPDYPNFPDVAHRDGRPQRGAQRLRGQLGPALLAIGVAVLVSTGVSGEVERAAPLPTVQVMADPAEGPAAAQPPVQALIPFPSQVAPAGHLERTGQPGEEFFEFGFDGQLGAVAPFGELFDQNQVEQRQLPPQPLGPNAAGMLKL